MYNTAQYKNSVTYQIGVDILGFPIYLIHHTKEEVTKGCTNKFGIPFGKVKGRKSSRIITTSKIVKQH
jgi:hypothetical protein